VITVNQLSVRQGDFALSNVTFQVPEGKYGILMGETGCGKTTILEAICGLRPVSDGQIVLAGRHVTHAKPALRGIGYVPQDAALFSTMTVYNHLAFALRIRKWAAEMIDARVQEMAQLLNISHLLQRKPKGLSGGEQQRVSLGRALAFRPRVLCLDEPLSALDESTRHQMYRLLKQVQQHEHVTALHVTHSSEEARNLGDVVFHIVQGRVVERTNGKAPADAPAVPDTNTTAQTEPADAQGDPDTEKTQTSNGKIES